jgi:FG-GAP repeat
MLMRRTAVLLAVALTVLAAGAAPGLGEPRATGTAPGRRAAPADLNADGFADLAVGAPGEDLGAFADDGGALHVLYGAASGLGPGADVFVQGSGGVGGTREHNDRFGSAVATGDFNGDGIVDVAVGAPGEAVASAVNTGAVNVLYGSAGGLTGGPVLTQPNAEAGDLFGAALAAADFDDDGFADLAVGVPGENVGAVGNAGAVTVLSGSDLGLTTAGSQTLFQGGNGVAGTAEAWDSFGMSLAPGIMGGDGIADLVVGVPREDVGATTNAGVLNILAGSPGGLTNGALVTQGNPEPHDELGFAVAVGDLDDTAGADVAAGAPGETVDAHGAAGAVSVFNGPPGGLDAERLLFQGSAGIPGTPEDSDFFGWAVAPTDADGTGRRNLAVGVPGEDLGADLDAGAVNLLRGSAAGPSAGSLVLQANPEDLDTFGAAIAGGFLLHDFDGNGLSDLAVGAPTETVGAGAAGAGAVTVYYASGGGVLTPGPAFTQGPGRLGGTPEMADLLGTALE